MSELEAVPEADAVLAVPVRVVVIDDTPDVRLLLRIALEGQGQFRVVAEAGDGAQGVELVAEHQPDLVLLDLAMPAMDGLEALPLLRTCSPDSKVVVLSGFAETALTDRVMQAGATGFIQKGASARTIVTRLSAMLDMTPQLPPRPAVTPDAEIARVHSAVASAAHELRGPATIMLAMSELLSHDRQTIDADTFNEMVDAIARQAQVLDRVTGDLLASTEARGGSLSVEIERVRLRPVIASLAMGFSDQVRLVVDCPQSIWVLADTARLQQILGNLVANAAKFGAPPVEISARLVDGEVAITVVDHGPGVPAEFVDRLFEQFSRADSAEVKGLGLGLYLVRSLTEAQGGRVQYAAVPAGGSSFCVSLPAAEPPD